MTRIYLVRHAKSVGNTQRIFQGHTNLGLSAEGQAQLPQLAERFRNIPLDGIYASPLLRAVQTAQAVGHYHKLPVQTREGLCEIFAGQWEAKSFADLPTLYPEAWRLWSESDAGFCAPDGESLAQVYERMAKAVGEIAAQNEQKSVAVVSHGCALRCYLCYALGLPIERIREVPLPKNTSVSQVVYDGGSISVESMDDFSHLELEENQEEMLV